MGAPPLFIEEVARSAGGVLNRRLGMASLSCRCLSFEKLPCLRGAGSRSETEGLSLQSETNPSPLRGAPLRQGSFSNCNFKLKKYFPAIGKLKIVLKKYFPAIGKLKIVLKKYFPDNGKLKIVLKKYFPANRKLKIEFKKYFPVIRKKKNVFYICIPYQLDS